MRFYEFKNIRPVAPKSALNQRIPSTPIPDKAKREPVVRWLAAKITRQANVTHVTQDDVALAVKRFNRNQKRVNLAYQNVQKSRL